MQPAAVEDEDVPGIERRDETVAEPKLACELHRLGFERQEGVGAALDEESIHLLREDLAA